MRVYALLRENILTWEIVTCDSAPVLLVPNSPSTAPSPPRSPQYRLIRPSLCCISLLYSYPQKLPWKTSLHIRLRLSLLLTQRLSLATLSTICSDSLGHKKARCSQTHMGLGPWHCCLRCSIQPRSNQPNATLKSKLIPLQVIFASCPHIVYLQTWT